ncbi:MAG: hypothetical protein VX353_03025 [Actinomycetota bacterium]|nr:hypothetical protein [Actinomycetota bacterium]
MSAHKAGRLKIFTALGDQKDLSASRGDVLNEVETYRKLSSFADVYYNGQLLQWDEQGFGIVPQEVELPDEAFDLYYCRNSPKLYQECKGPLLIMAYPYDPDIWEMVDGVVVTTYAWKNFLDNYNERSNELKLYDDPWYPDSILKPRHITVFGQSITPRFTAQDNGKISKLYRAAFGEGFSVGYLGRIDPTCYPHQVIAAIKEIRKVDDRISLTFMGHIREVVIPGWIQIYSRQTLEMMPHVVSAFDCLIYDQDITGDYLGSVKCLEAMARGVPILVRPYEARIEQFGGDYPLYYQNEQEAESLLVKLKDDRNFRSSIREYLLERRSYYYRENAELRLQVEVLEFLNTV